MQYVKLGGTGLKASRIGFGGIPLQRLDKSQAAEIVFRALDKGINFFDTARAYSVSEDYLSCLARKRGDVIIASKAPALKEDAFEKEIDTSLSNLKTDYIDLYQAHNIRTIEHLKTAMQEGGAFSALRKAVKQGKVRYVGITSHSCEVLDFALSNYPGEFDTVMYPYNIVETQGVKMFAKAKVLNKGVLAMKPLGGGNLTDARLAMRFVLSNPDIDVALAGMAAEKEVDENTSISFGKLTEKELAECAETVKTLDGNFCRRCGYCAPCPQGIDIPVVFTMNNYLKHYGLAQWAASRYTAMAKRAKDCVACRQCEPRCPYNLKIADKMKEVKKNFDE